MFHLECAVVADTQLCEQQLADQPAATRRVVDVGDAVQDLPEIHTDELQPDAGVVLEADLQFGDLVAHPRRRRTTSLTSCAGDQRRDRAVVERGKPLAVSPLSAGTSGASAARSSVLTSRSSVGRYGWVRRQRPGLLLGELVLVEQARRSCAW